MHASDYDYVVVRTYPLPVQILMVDLAVAATPADQIAIERLSGLVTEDLREHLHEEVEICLVIPAVDRWLAQGWRVIREASQIAACSEYDEARAFALLDDSAKAKLTSEEFDAMNRLGQ